MAFRVTNYQEAKLEITLDSPPGADRRVPGIGSARGISRETTYVFDRRILKDYRAVDQSPSALSRARHSCSKRHQSGQQLSVL